MRLIQVTLGAGATPIVSSATVPVSYKVLMIQNNSAANVRYGDSTVSASKGILLLPGGAATITPAVPANDLTQYYLFGTATDLIDVAIVG